MRYLAFFALLLLIANCSFAQSQSQPDWNAATDLKIMQGEWNLNEEQSILHAFTEFDAIVPEAGKQLSVIRIEKNRLYLDDGRIELLICNELGVDLDYKVQDGLHLFCAIVPGCDGRAFLGAYKIEGDELFIRFPHTCGCGRTGKIARFRRDTVKSNGN